MKMKNIIVAIAAIVMVAGVQPAAAKGVRASKAKAATKVKRSKVSRARARARARSRRNQRRTDPAFRHRVFQQAASRRPTRQGPEIKPKGLKPKNRGKLSTLKGLRKGKKLKLVDPTTGYVDSKAKIVETGIDPWSKTPYAWVKFSNFNEMRFAAERLQLIGKPLGFQKRYIKTKRAKLYKAMEKHLGVPVQGRAKLVILRGRNYGPKKRKRVNGPRLGPFLRALGEHMEPDEGIVGFARDQTAFVSRHYGAWDSTTTAHELIHAITEPFIDQADRKGLVGMMEGFTDYFTYKVSTPHFGAEPNPNHPYNDFLVFASHVAKTVGEKRTKDLFFSARKDSLKELARAYDAKVGKRGIFYRRSRALEDGTLVFDAKGEPSIQK